MTSASTSSSEKGCTVCDHLRRLFAEPELYLYLGSLDETLKTPCPGHDQLLQFIRDECASTERDRPLLKDEWGLEKSKSDRLPYINSNLFSEDRLLLGSRRWPILLGRRKDETQTPGCGRFLGRDWIDLDLINDWKRECITSHENCHNPHKIPHVSPAWLIDTVLGCLVPGNGISEYVALSYRWSASAGFRTSTRLLEALRKPRALFQADSDIAIPPSILHAIGLTQAIDERYLWVDAICIVQDDKVHMAEQLQLMGTIYASAKLTIVATDGDATDGILGLKGISPSRELDQRVIPLFERERIIIRNIPHLQRLLSDSPYFDRGWTFQEYFLSKRRLIFAHKEVHWVCACRAWREDLIQREGESSDPDLESVDFSNLTAGQPDFRILDKLIKEYNHRQLTFPEDVLPAITGLLAILGRSFEGGFLFGLPETCFDSALTWYFERDAEDTQPRRRPGRSESLLSTTHLPSWSWMSYKGSSMMYLGEEPFEGYGATGSRTTPITQWYAHDSPNSVSRRAIRATWFNRRVEEAKDVIAYLADGWSREEYRYKTHHPVDDPDALPEYMVRHVYRHASLPGKVFWLPIPLAAVDENTIPPSPPQTPYVSCETQRAWFTATRYANTESGEVFQYRSYVRLLNSDRERCGILFLDSCHDKSLFPRAESGRVLTVEVVAICLQHVNRVYYDLLETTVVNGPLHPVFEDFYAVLWIEWADGVAYRKAMGLVEKDKWEEYDRSDVHLVLG